MQIIKHLVIAFPVKTTNLSPPKPHSFVSLPLQSIFFSSLKNGNSRSLKQRFALCNPKRHASTNTTAAVGVSLASLVVGVVFQIMANIFVDICVNGISFSPSYPDIAEIALEDIQGLREYMDG